MAEHIPAVADHTLAKQIVDSSPVIDVFASNEWSELHEDGQAWVAAIVAEATKRAPGDSFQAGVADWMLACFGPEIAADRLERADRFTEEALELAQTMPGFTADRAHALVDYVFGRPIGERHQEVGGVMVTLAALCNSFDLSIATEADRELARVWTKVEAIRAKQATKPVGSALPVALEPLPAADPVAAFIEYLATVSEEFAWAAGVGACETAGAILSYLAKHPEKLGAFQTGGFFEMCPEPGTDLHREGRLSWMAADGKVWTPEKVAAALAAKEGKARG